MIYLITKQTQLIQEYEIISEEESIEQLNKLERISLDTETTGFSCWSNRLLTIQLGDNENQYVIDLTTVDIQIYKPIIESKPIILHNGQFDLRFLYFHDIIPNEIYDTFLAECIITQGLKLEKKSLEAVCNKYCNYQLTKAIRGVIHKEGMSSRVVRYCAEDIEYLEAIREEQLKILTSRGQLEQLRLENEYCKVIAYVAYCGIRLDKAKWQEKCDLDLEQLRIAESKLNEWGIANGYRSGVLDLFEDRTLCNIKWNSSQKVIPVFKKLGFDLLVKDKKTGKMKYSVESKVIDKQKELSDLAPIYLDYKAKEKVVSTYGENWFGFIDKGSNRIHSSFWQIQNTGRLSSGSDKEEDTDSPNFQNIPADGSRECFIPEEGNIMVNADYDGMEVRVFTNQSQERNLIKFFQEGTGDMHCETARKLFKEIENLSDEEIKKHHKDKRQAGKIASFTLQFGGQGYTIAQNLGVPVELGESIYSAYMNAYPDIKNYFAKVRKLALERGYIEICAETGARCYLYSWKKLNELREAINWETREPRELYKEYFKTKSKIERDASNYPTQGLSAIINKVAGVYIFRWIVENNLFNTVKFINVIHDENLLECPIEMGEQVKEVVEKAMVDAGNRFCYTIPLTATADLKTKWKK